MGGGQRAALFHLQRSIFFHDEPIFFKFGALSVDILGDPVPDLAVAVVLDAELGRGMHGPSNYVVTYDHP